MLVMRRRAPDTKRAVPHALAWLVGIFGILGCLYLLYSLPRTTQIWFLGAQVVGLVLYLLYGARRASRATQEV